MIILTLSHKTYSKPGCLRGGSALAGQLHPATLVKWGCQHQPKTTTNRLGEDDLVRVRDLICRHCSLKVKTEERLVVPWDAEDLVDQVKALLPEGQALVLRDKGVTELPLARLNARLALRGYVIHASKGHDPKELVACTGEDGRVEQYELFELRLIQAGSSGSMIDIQHKRN